MANKAKPRPLVLSASPGLTALIAALGATLAGITVAFTGPRIIALIPGVVVLGLLLRLLRRPAQLLFVFTMFLPWHVMLMVFLHGQLGLDSQLVRYLQLWKEALTLVGFLAGCLLVLQQGLWWRIGRLGLLDVLVICFTTINVVMAMWPTEGTTFGMRALAARSHTFFVMPYVLGRLLPLSDRDKETFVDVILALAILTIISVPVEHFLLPRYWQKDFGLVAYLHELKGGLYADGPLGIPWSFFTEAGQYRRGIGFYANPLDLAASLHVMVGVALSYTICVHHGWRRRVMVGLLIALFLVMVSTLARVSSVVAMLTTLVIPWVLRRLQIDTPVTLLFLMVFGGALAFLSMSAVGFEWPLELIERTITFEHSSSAGHLLAWREGLRALTRHPFGLGLGNSGAVAVQNGRAIGGENLYITLGIELGIQGALLYVALLGAAYWTALKVAACSRDPLQRVVACAALGGLHGIILLGLSSQISIYLFINWVSWWLVGYLTTVMARAPVESPALPSRLPQPDEKTGSALPA